jgi:5-(carboxyamino)imidazole ribonucleotide synthase
MISGKQTKADVIAPGSWIGILGGGQLGRMSCIAAKQLGYRVAIRTDEVDAPASQVADKTFLASYSDREVTNQFVALCDVVTVEFENLPKELLQQVESKSVLRPSSALIETSQHRIKEKSALAAAGMPVTPFVAVSSLVEASVALEAFGGKAVLKTATMGYDGKGQQFIDNEEALRACWSVFEGKECCLERRIDLDIEVSILVARSLAGEQAVLGPFHNVHKNHILDVSSFPAPVSDTVTAQLVVIANQAASSLGLIGLLCIEFFIAKDGSICINELAPRPHNSGHLTIEAFACSQFEQHVRAICNLPLGSTKARSAAAMANLLGDCWGADGSLHWHGLAGEADCHLHLYGKKEPRHGRKMGHVTALDDIVEGAVAKVKQVREILSGS